MPLVLDGTNGVSGVDGTASNPSYEGTDSNTGIFYPAADTVAIGTGGTERLRVDSSGNVGVGTTSPGATLDVSVAFPSMQINATTGTNRVWLRTGNTGGDFYFGRENSAGNSFGVTAYSSVLWSQGAYPMVFATNGTERMRLDASGILLVGTTSASASLAAGGLQVTDRICVGTGSVGTPSLHASGDTNTGLYFPGADIVGFATGGTERARITSDGFFKAQGNTTYQDSTSLVHEFMQSSTSAQTLIVENKNASIAVEVLFVAGNRNTTNSTWRFLRCFNRATSTDKLLIADSGTVTNTTGTYGTISDVKMKTDIVDAGSQWEDIKAIRFRKFKMLDDPDKVVQLGVVAQEIEQTSPGLVEEHKDLDAEGNDLGTTTKSVKTSVMLMKAAVALQEAMTRIEQLEAKVAALESA